MYTSVYALPTFSISPPITIIQLENDSFKTQLDTRISQEHKAFAGAIATPSPPETLPPEFSTDKSQDSYKIDHENITASNITTENALDSDTKQLSQQVVAQSITPSAASQNSAIRDIKSTLRDIRNAAHSHNVKNQMSPEKEQKINNNIVIPISTSSDVLKSSTGKNNPPANPAINNILAEAKSLLLGVFINGQEVGSLEVIPDEGKLLIPLFDFAQIAGFTVENIDIGKTQLKTPLGVVTVTESDLKKLMVLLILVILS